MTAKCKRSCLEKMVNSWTRDRVNRSDLQRQKKLGKRETEISGAKGKY